MIYLKIFVLSFLLMSCGGKLGDKSRRPNLRDSNPRNIRDSNPRHIRESNPQREPERFLNESEEREKEYCYNFSTCRNVCNNIYTHPAEKGRCLDRSVDEVEDIYSVAFRLSEPMTRDLRRIDKDRFNLFIEVGTETFNQYIFEYTVPQAKRVLAWLAEDRGIARAIFSLGQEEYRNIVLNLMHSMDPVIVENALHTNLRGGGDFYQISNEQNNDYAVYMVHQVIANDLCHVRHQYSFFDLYDFNETCILRVYCHEDRGSHTHDENLDRFLHRHVSGGPYIHKDDFSFISDVIEYDDIFDYISEEDPDYGLGITSSRRGEITPAVCNRICTDNSCR